MDVDAIAEEIYNEGFSDGKKDAFRKASDAFCTVCKKKTSGLGFKLKCELGAPCDILCDFQILCTWMDSRIASSTDNTDG